jgi:hypothetical protein
VKEKNHEFHCSGEELYAMQTAMLSKEESRKSALATLKKAKSEERIRPKSNWDDIEKTVPGVVWHAALDGRYLVEVQRPEIQAELSTDAYFGYLLVFDHQKEDKLIYSKVVHLAYGALFGPDISDVDEWQEKVTHFIDKKYKI